MPTSTKSTSTWSPKVLATLLGVFILLLAVSVWMYTYYDMEDVDTNKAPQLSEREMLIQNSTASGNTNTMSKDETSSKVKSSSASGSNSSLTTTEQANVIQNSSAQ